MKSLILISAVLALLGIADAVIAEDKTDSTGTWKWKLFNQSAEHTLKLNLKGDRLTGSIQRRANDRESPIENATYKDGTLNFTVIFTSDYGDGRKIPTKFTGKVDGDRIKGEIEYDHPERKILRDWDATRIK